MSANPSLVTVMSVGFWERAMPVPATRPFTKKPGLAEASATRDKFPGATPALDKEAEEAGESFSMVTTPAELDKATPGPAERVWI